MERLGGLDTAFLSCETPGMHMHVCGLVLLDPGGAAPDEVYRGIRSLLLGALPYVPLMAKRPVVAPLGIGRPFWVDDAAFDLDHHLHRARARPPGDDAALADLVGEVASVPLRHDRPLWETWVIEGLADGRVGLLAKMHHATIDGIAAMGLMGRLFDLEPRRPRRRRSTGTGSGRGAPSQVALLGEALAELLRAPFGFLGLLPGTVFRLASMAARSRSRRHGRPDTAAAFSAPRTSFNATLTPRRSVAFTHVPLADVTRVKEAYGVKVNDVLSAVVGGALRRYLDDRGELPKRSLVAAEPVSVHGPGIELGGVTRLSVMFSTLATAVADPAERLRTVAAANARGKEVSQMVGADTLMRWSEYVWPSGYALGARLYSRLRLADRHPVVHNLLFSNVPGPPVDLYLAGARVNGIYPFGPVFDGAGLNVTAISWDGRVDFGVIGCPDLVPDVRQIADALPEALGELVATVAPRPRGGARAQRRRPPGDAGTATEGSATEGAGGGEAAGSAPGLERPALP